MTLITEIVSCGPQAYTHHCMQTMTESEACDHELGVPGCLATLAKRHPDDAIVVEFGDGTLGIEVAGRIWAAEFPHSEMRPAKSLQREVWQYIRLATGGDGDTRATRY